MFEGLFEVVWKSTAFFTAVFIAILLILYLYQNKLLYLPDSPNRYPRDNTTGIREPGEAELEYEDVTIQTKDGIKLHGWFVKMQDPKHYPTFVYFHENAGNIGSRIPFIRFLQAYCYVNVLLVAYRGYSYSEGIPTEQGLQIDALAVLGYIFSRSDINTDKIFVFGRSLGGAVSIYGLSHSNHQAAGLILENTFTSISDMVDIVFAKLSKIKKLVLNNHWHSIRDISSLKVPIMFIMGLKDELIPTTQMERLYRSAENAYFKEKYEVHSGTHNDTWSRDVEDYFDQINTFIDKCLKHGPQNSYV